MLVVVLGLACVFSPGVLVNGFDFAVGQSWHDLFFALPLAMLAYTGLETVANLAEETREPGRMLPRSLFSSIGLVVIMTVLIAIVALSAFPAEDGSTDLADDWLQAPIVGIVTAFDGHLPAAMVDILRVVVGLSGALILFAAATTAITGLHAARPLDGRARDAAARVRPARAALARLARGARRHRRGRDRDRRRHGHLRQGRPCLPRQRLLVRGAVRLHRGAARRDPAPPQGAGSRAPVPGQAGGA